MLYIHNYSYNSLKFLVLLFSKECCSMSIKARTVGNWGACVKQRLQNFFKVKGDSCMHELYISNYWRPQKYIASL